MTITNLDALTRTIDHREIFHDEMLALVRRIMSGEMSPVLMAALLVGLRVKKETIGEITAAAQVMREFSTKVEVADRKNLVDIVGTGGDGSHTFNISTCSMFVAAAAGAQVAKHGNRSVSSRTGSADVLEALGVPVDVAPGRHPDILRRAGITFLFAPAHHPAMRHSGPARRELAVRTIFNALGPIANPAGATHQLIGAYDDRLRGILAETLGKLGSRHAWVVRGEDGLDEISPFGPTRVTELAGGALRERVVTPEDFGLSRAAEGALDGGDAAANASRIRAILGGEEDAAQGAVALNAAAAIAVGRERTDDAGLREAAREAVEALRSGAALRTLDGWRAILGEGA